MGKRVNTKFLIGLTVVIGGLAVMAFVAAGVYYSRHTAAFYLKRADVEQANHNWEKAAAYTQIALNKDPSNKPLYLRLGDLCEKLVPKDPIYMTRAMGIYQRALELDPSYTPAIDRLLAILVAEMRDGQQGAAFFNNLKSIADRGVASDKKNPHYQAYSHIAAVQQWFYSSGHSNPVIEKDVAALDELARQNPQEADAAYYASQAQFREIGDLQGSGNVAEFHRLLDQINARHEAAVKARPQDPAVQLRAFQTFAEVAQFDDRKDTKAATSERAGAAIKTALASAKPADDVYDDIQHWYILWLRNGKPVNDKDVRQQVVKAFEQWTQARPHDQRATTEMAEFLSTDPAQRDRAIKILSNPIPTDPDLQGHAALLVRGNERARLIDLNSYRIADAEASRDPKARQGLLSLIDTDLTRIASMGFVDNPPLLKLRGKYQMLLGNQVAAIKELERAQALMSSEQIDPDLWAHLVQAYMSTGQTGTAASMMEKLLLRAPGTTAVRVQLAELYLRTGQVDKAAEQVKLLQAGKLDDPSVRENVSRLALVVAHQRHSGDEKQQLAALPENTRDEMLFKARMANDMNEPAEAVRMYRALLKNNPADFDAVAAWVGLLLHEKNTAQAQQVVADALKAKPDDSSLKVLRDRLAANTPEAFRKLEDEMANQVKDPVMRSLRKAQLAMDRGQWPLAWQQLDQADQASANDPRALISRIQWYVEQRKFDDAAPWLDKAAAANADKMEGLSLRVRVALRREDAAGALKWANQLVGKYDQFSVNWLLLARAQQLAGQYVDAVNSCDASLSRQPASTEALKLKAECLEALGRYDEQRAVIAQAVALAPEDTVLRDVDLNFELHHGDPDKVIARCEDLLKKEPDNMMIYAATGQACEVAASSKYGSDPAMAKKLLERARDVLNQGISKSSNDAEKARFYIPLARAMVGLGDVPAAETLLRKLADQPDQKNKPDASSELAALYERFNRLPEAEQAWRDAYARSGKSVETELSLAQFLIRHQRTDDALKVLEANNGNPRVKNQQIETLLNAGRLAEARKLLDQVYSTTPTSPVALYYRGIIELNENDATSAVTDLSSARDKDPRNLEVRIALSRALLARGRRDDAVVELVDVLHRNALRADARMLLLEADSLTPPRWDDFDRVVQEAQTNPILSSDPTWHQLHARGLAARGLFDQAKQEIATARKMAPQSFALQEENVNILVRAKDWPAVLAETDKELAAGHHEGFVYGKRGIAYAGLKDKAAAAKEFDAGLAAYKGANNTNGITDLLQTISQTLGTDEALSRLGYLPEGPQRYLLAMDLYGQKGDLSNRIKNAELALSQPAKLTMDQRISAIQAKIDCYIMLSKLDPAHAQWDKAHEALDQLLSLRPNDMSALNNVAYLTAEMQHDPQTARTYSSRAYDLAMRSDQNPGVIDSHGWILTLCGGSDARKGLLILETLVQSHQNLTKAHYHLAVAYLRQGRFPEAAQEIGVVQQQIKQMQANKQPVDDELQTGVPKALEEIRQKSGRGTG